MVAGSVMSARRASTLISVSAAIIATSLASVAPASAQNLFDTLFGGLRRAFEHSSRPQSGSNDPFSSLARAFNPSSSQPAQQPRTADGNPSRGFCVRTCDGRYFPVQSRGNVSAAEMCHAFCPTAETKLYSGSNIDFATTRDGSRYVDLDNAYLYRKQLVAGCSCNGRDGMGLAHVNVDTDPTLRPGDVVATTNGLVAYDSNGKKANDFTPVQNYSAFPKSYRDQLSAMRIAPSNPGAPKDITSSITPQAKAARADQGTGQSAR
jgi:Protein of unknown function (DUF2865)